MLGKAEEFLSASTGEDYDLREYNSITIPIDPKRIPDAKKKIAQFQRSLWEFMTQGEALELYQFNLQLFPLARAENAKAAPKRVKK